MKYQQPESPPQRLPSPGRAASPAVEEAQASPGPIIHCSQYQMEKYELQNGPHMGHDSGPHEKVGGWLLAAYASNGPSRSPYPAPPAAPHKDQYFSDLD